MGIPGEERITWTASLHHRQVGLLHIQSPRLPPPWGRTPMFTTGLPIGRCLGDLDDEVVPPFDPIRNGGNTHPSGRVRGEIPTGLWSRLPKPHRGTHERAPLSWSGLDGERRRHSSNGAFAGIGGDGGGERVGGWWRQSIGRRDVRGGWGWGCDRDVWSGREEGKQAAGFFPSCGVWGRSNERVFSCGRQSNEGGRRETGRGRLAGKGKLCIF